jgi:kynurenine formamidase
MTGTPASPVRGVVDLSHPLADGMPVYPGDPVASIRPATTIAEHGYNVLHVHMGSQTGTHVDAPYHFLQDGARIDELPLELFLGPAVVSDLRGRQPRTPVTWTDLLPVAHRLAPGRMLLLHTGWDAHWGSPEYSGHPFLDGEAAERVVAAGVRTVGIDALSLDETVPAGSPAAGFEAHMAVLGAGGVIVENLRGLELVRSADPLVSVLPLRLAGADGAPVRAVAFDVDPSARTVVPPAR